MMKLSYGLFVCSLAYCYLASMSSTRVDGYEFYPCSDPNILSSSRCLLDITEVEKECECQSHCDEDDRCAFVFYNPDTKDCRLYDHTEKQIETTGWECATIIDCGVPVFNDGMDVKYTRTSYGSVAEIECALGYFPTPGEFRSVCQGNGRWSKPTGVCEKYPEGRGFKELPESDAILECRNVISDPSLRGKRVEAQCAEDEIMTGCASKSDRDTVPYEAGVFSATCATQGYNGRASQAVARCCKLPGLRCEYIRNVELTGFISCYKDFYLLDCACRVSAGYAGQCPITMKDSQCLHPSQTAELKAWRVATCCDLGDYSCYGKEVTGLASADSDYLSIRCDNVGEVMTSCSGYSLDYSVFESLIKAVDGTDECQLRSGPGNITALYGYATCCERQQG